MHIQGVLFDRDGTIVEDVPYNGNPELVQPVRDARGLLDRLRAAGLRVGVLTNQSGVGRGIITEAQMHAVNARVEALLGPFDGWFICPHAPADDCECRKPKPKLVLDAARAWGVKPAALVVVGDKESDVEAARNAGASGVLVGEGFTLADAVAAILSDARH
ncbi:MAG: HAD family hydrolase [bacterium]|nr:HAD family hydrolase [bacterium]